MLIDFKMKSASSMSCNYYSIYEGAVIRATPPSFRMETGFGIGPIANLAQLPDRVEACGRRQPTKPVLSFSCPDLHPHGLFKILHTFNDDVHGAPVADGKL